MNKVEKMYVAYKPCEKPRLTVQWQKGQPFMDVTDYGLTYYEDEVGFYYKQGELVCDAV